MLKYKLITPGCTPERMRDEDAGYDLRAAADTTIFPNESAVIPLGVAIAIPRGIYGMLTHRSSLAFKKNGLISLGVIDSNFRQEIKAKVFNQNLFYSLKISAGDRIAQLILHRYESLELEEVEDLGIGKGGFGSSGVN